MTILDELAAYAAVRVEKDKQIHSLEELKERCSDIKRGMNLFLKGLQKEDLSFICEVKKASPSKGLISEDFPYLEIAKEYEAAGADCVSCLTEPKWFLGSDKIFTDIRSAIDTPMIRKDFTVDEYQIYQAKCMGADAVLLICSILDNRSIEKYLGICEDLGIDALVETHNAQEIADAIACGSKIIGVNNRNLKDFSVDFSNAERLRELIPDNCIYVAESGVKSPEDVAKVRKIGADAVLMGEVLMRAKDKRGMLEAMRNA